MKDLQPRRRSPDPRIPIISPILHVLSMSVVVFLRFNFGFTYFRPLAVFATIAWVWGLFCVYAYHQEGLWDRWGVRCCYGLVALCFYFVHFSWATWRELRKKAKHDHFSGVSIFFRGKKDLEAPETHRGKWLWETVLVVVLGLILRELSSERMLGTWLLLAGFSLFLKESLNRWYQIRKKKQNLDALEDAEDLVGSPVTIEGSLRKDPSSEANKQSPAFRKKHPSLDEVSELLHHAKVLGMQPPYNYTMAKVRYRFLVQERHPDACNSMSIPLPNPTYQELRESLLYFEKKRIEVEDGMAVQDNTRRR